MQPCRGVFIEKKNHDGNNFIFAIVFCWFRSLNGVSLLPSGSSLRAVGGPLKRHGQLIYMGMYEP